MKRGIFLTGIVTLGLWACPSFAEDNANNAPNPSLAMATASASTDSLGAFGPSSGTAVGNRAVELHDSILRLRSSVNLNSNEFATLRSMGAAGAVQYHSTVAAITARLQNGTTKGNPILLRQWEEANNSLGEVTSSLTRLNTLQTAVDSDASTASYLLESVQAAFELSGAVDEDHDQLKLLKDEISRLVVQLDYLRNQTLGDIERQTTYLSTERSNLQTLAFAISRGELLDNAGAGHPVIVTTSPVSSMPTMQNNQLGASAGLAMQHVEENTLKAPTGNSAVAPSIGHLLVLIRYNQPHVDYEQQLSKAISTAIERRPNATFAVVAVTPSSGDPADLAQQQQEANRNADAVKRSLVQLGLSPSRISMANAQIQTAQTPEVHVYIR